MKIQKNDTVQILSGKDNGKTGKIIKVIPAEGKDSTAKVVVEGLNLRYKHMRPKRDREKGQRIQFPYPLDISKVALVCPKCGKVTRVGYKVFDTKLETSRDKKQRICRKCSNVI